MTDLVDSKNFCQAISSILLATPTFTASITNFVNKKGAKAVRAETGQSPVEVQHKWNSVVVERSPAPDSSSDRSRGERNGSSGKGHKSSARSGGSLSSRNLYRRPQSIFSEHINAKV